MDMSVPGQQATRLPDFIIGGAPKCGTTSLHFILGQNPEIGLPDEEIHYFDADDPITHPDFLFAGQDGLSWFDARPAHADNYAWYASRFSPFQSARRIGEDSTTYLFSEVAPARIKSLLPDVKLIFMLRDPVKRAYSQYWHLIRSARTSATFEQAIIDHPSILKGSTFAPHLRTYLKTFDPGQIRIVLFEDFLADQQGTIDSLTDFIDAPRMSLDTAETWFNRTLYPSRPALQRLQNRLGKHIVARRYRTHMGEGSDTVSPFWHKMHYRWFAYVAPLLLTREKAPPMDEATRAYLAQHLSARNAGLSDLLDRDLSQVWTGFEG